ncbi:hypothetical protein DIS24_g4939 [Lasiodiplodia hormozganensis]|uniref:Uncharacterized protein n=1 Tax=Lasiodiplodia hormozganensis TaxID=869390 RepID=A0AA39YT75_9PEZI|nr:hypothetical protein DIS24_g4939 [Lasiodiplodia hormozganensis]
MHILMGFFPAGNASRPLAFDFPATAPPRENPDPADGQRLLIPTPDCNADEPQHKSADWRFHGGLSAPPTQKLHTKQRAALSLGDFYPVDSQAMAMTIMATELAQFGSNKGLGAEGLS